tara:strand:+ start:1721 stop:2062 length:342 start_codon:yes stop_codon:yes gene_type:complete
MTRTINYPEMTKEKSRQIMLKNPNRIPVLVTKLHNDLEMKKTKYLVPFDLTMGQLQYVFRRSLDNIDSSEAIFIFIDKHQLLIQSSAIMKQIYDQYNDDGFLRVHISKENTFG